MRLHVSALLPLMMIACVDVPAASFDCTKAATKVEKLICADSGLSTQDKTLAAVYRQAASLTAGGSEPRQSQRLWLKRRNACADADCVAALYASRIAELEDAIGQDLNAETIAGTYTRRDDDYSDDGEPSEITLRALPDGRVAIDGEALWIGNADTGNVHTGTISGDHDVHAGRIYYRDGTDEWSCVLTLRFTRDALDIDEPRMTCGGANVSFAGHYVRN